MAVQKKAAPKTAPAPKKAAPAKAQAKKVIAKAPAKAAPVKKGVPAAKAPAKTGAFGRPIVPGAKKKAPAKKKTALPTYTAPADFKPHFCLLTFMTDKDGLMGSSLKATRYAGRFDREADDRKKSNVVEYDPQTVIGIATRFGCMTFKTSIDRIMPVSPKERVGLKGSNRLPKSTIFEALIRVGKRASDQSLTASVRQVFQVVKITKGTKTTQKPVLLEKTDPAYRLIRRVNRILPAAFKNVQMPPKRTRGSRKTEDGADE